MEGSKSFRKPQASSSPRRRARSPAHGDPWRLQTNDGPEDYGSDAASRFEPTRTEPFVPVAYPIAEVAPAAERQMLPTAVPHEEEGSVSRNFNNNDNNTNSHLSDSTSDEEPEMSEFAHSEFMNSDFRESYLGTEYSQYLNSESAASGSDPNLGAREWSFRQQVQNPSGGGWGGASSRRLGDGYPPGRSGKFAGDDGRMHDLPPLPERQKMPSNHSVLSHDLSGFSDFDPNPGHERHGSASGRGSGGGGTSITAPHLAPKERNWTAVGAGLTGAAAAAADADARNLARKQQRDRELVAAAARADEEKKRAKRAALAAAGGSGSMQPPGPHGGSSPRSSGGQSSRGFARGLKGRASVRDVGDSKEETRTGSVGVISSLAGSNLARLYGDGAQSRGGEHAMVTHYSLIFTPLMFLICGILLFWEFSLNGWVAQPLAENPSYGPSVDTLIRAGAKRTDLIVDDGEGWRLIAPMFLHAGVVHFLFNMLGFLQIGAMVERVFGWWRVGSIYLVAGVFGTIVSAIFVPTQVMVGASGAIFGVFGALWADLWQNWAVHTGRCRMLTLLTVLTVTNLIIGLMPFLDNFAHIGGMIMGFTMGLGVLVQKRENDFGDRLEKKCYQISLQLVAAIAVPTLLILGLSLLYGRSDPTEWCGWCENISCVEFPPGNNPWWFCDECSTTGFSAEKFSDGTITITCPDGSTESSGSCSDASDALLVDCCISLCL